MDIRDLISYFKKRIWIVALTFIFCMILSGFFTYFNKVNYLSTPKIIVGPQSIVSKDGKFVTNLVFVLSDLIENEKVAMRLANETGLNINKDNLKNIVSTSLNDQHQRMYIMVRSSDRETVTKVSDKLPDIIASVAKELFNIDNLLVIKSDKIVVEGKNYKKNIVSGGVAGIGLGVFIIFAILIYDDRLRNRKDIKRLFGIDYLGMINNNLSGKECKKDNLSLLCTKLLLKAGNTSSKIIANITMELEDSGKGTFMVAKQLSLLGRKVLMVELDNSSKTAESNVTDNVKYGFSDLLDGENIGYAKAVYKTSINNLDLCPFGTRDDINILTLTKPDTIDFIKKAKTEYDIVLFNIPYSLGIDRILMFSHTCDGTVLSIKQGKVTITQAETLIENLKESGINILGYSVAI